MVGRTSILESVIRRVVPTNLKQDWALWILGLAYLLYFSIGQLPSYGTITLWGVLPISFIIIFAHFFNHISKVPPELWLYLLFFMWATLTGINIHVDSITFYTHVRRVFICLLLMFCVWIAMRSSNNIGVLMICYFLSSLFVAGYSLITGDLYDVINQEELSYEYEGEVYVTAGRLHGISGNANGMGSYCILGFISLSYIFFETKSKILKAFYIGSAILFFYTVLAAGTRGGLFMSAAYIAIWTFTTLKYKVDRKGTFPTILVLLVAGSIYLYDNVVRTSTVGLRVSTQSNIAQDKRTQIIENSYEIFTENIVSGVGLDQIQFYTTDEAIAHNDYLEVLGDTGIIGGILYYSIFFIVGRRLYKYRSMFQLVEVRYKLNFLFSIFLLLLIYGIAKQHLWDFSYMLLIGIMIGYTHLLKNEYRLNF